MSLAGNIAVEAEMDRLLEMMERLKGEPEGEQLKILRDHIEKTKAAAASGWL